MHDESFKCKIFTFNNNMYLFTLGEGLLYIVGHLKICVVLAVLLIAPKDNITLWFNSALAPSDLLIILV